jgi:putative DeoR family transcriptional regulator (stage III sporulation protein D)
LPLLDAQLAREVDKVLSINRAQRHIRGGEATKRKYMALREEDEAEDT